jgi:hypothetical protein
MTESAVKTSKTAELLEAVYKNVKMASDSILTLMPKVKDERLKQDMTTQLSVFDAYASRAAKLLGEEGVKPEEENLMVRMSAKMGSMMNTMRDSTSTHLAEMLVEGATMGVNDMLKQLRRAENTTVSESALRLARDVCAYEEKLVEELKDSYLR